MSLEDCDKELKGIYNRGLQRAEVTNHGIRPIESLMRLRGSVSQKPEGSIPEGFNPGLDEPQ